MKDEKRWYVRTEDEKVYGPAAIDSLVKWAQDGRIGPTSFVSSDRIAWIPAQLVPELELKWLVESEPGKVFGPFHRSVVSSFFKNGELDDSAKVYRLHEFAIDEDPPPVEKIVEREVIKEVRVEVQVEKIVEKVVEKIVEVPVEKIVEKIVEVPPPPRTEIVVAEVVEPEAEVPPPKIAGSIFGNVDRQKLATLEAAVRRELSAANRGRVTFGLFGGKRKK